jgi:hypothetical protein
MRAMIADPTENNIRRVQQLLEGEMKRNKSPASEEVADVRK